MPFGMVDLCHQTPSLKVPTRQRQPKQAPRAAAAAAEAVALEVTWPQLPRPHVGKGDMRHRTNRNEPTHSESASATRGPKEMAAQPASAGGFLVESRHCSGPQ